MTETNDLSNKQESILSVQLNAPDNPYLNQANQEDNPQYFNQKTLIIIRTSIFIMALSVLILVKKSIPNVSVACLTDHFMDLLTPTNQFINQNPFWRDFFQILSSGILDLSFLVTVIPWIAKGTTGRILYSILTFYTIRAISQQFITMGFPPGHYWDAPIFPSIVVPYGPSSDYFFSGHVGFLLIMGCENWVNGVKWIFAFCMISEIYLIFVLMTYRVHYSSDIIAGLFISHWSFLICSKGGEGGEEVGRKSRGGINACKS